MNVNHRAENGEKEKKSLSFKCLNSFFKPRIFKSDQNPALYHSSAYLHFYGSNYAAARGGHRDCRSLLHRLHIERGPFDR